MQKKPKKGKFGGPQDTNKHGTAGRPTKYKPEYCEEIVKYFDVPYYDYNPAIKKFMPNDLPLFSKFAFSIGICVDTLKKWRDQHPDFLSAYKKAKELQEAMLITNGLSGRYNTAFAIFAAKNMIGWRDKTELSGDKANPLQVVIEQSESNF